MKVCDQCGTDERVFQNKFVFYQQDDNVACVGGAPYTKVEIDCELCLEHSQELGQRIAKIISEEVQIYEPIKQSQRGQNLEAKNEGTKLPKDN